jgi:hypothetical protein
MGFAIADCPPQRPAGDRHVARDLSVVGDDAASHRHGGGAPIFDIALTGTLY